MTDLVAEKLQLLPDSPGVYIMKDAQGKIIYVGKAIVLKNRVRQYFQSNKNHSPKVRAMERIEELEASPRGPYAGALVFLDPCGDLDSCIALRTLLHRDGVVEVRTGAGVVVGKFAEKKQTEEAATP